MLWPWHLQRAAWLLALCLLTQCHVHPAGSLALGEEAHPGSASPQAPSGPASEVRVRSLPEASPGAEKHGGRDRDLFQGVDPKALAAILLQALGTEPQQPEPSEANEERVQSQTTRSDVLQLPEGEAGKDGARAPEEGEPEEPRGLPRQEAERLQALLEELRQYSPAAKREAPTQDRQADAAPVPKEPEEPEPLRVHTKRKAPPSEPWVGARKLRQQQHLEHQLLQRRYEELAESRRQAEEARRAAAEEERLADMASDLLLQYLLKDGEEEEEQRQGASAREESEEEGGKGSSLLFEDEEGNVAEDKRSNEALEEDGEDGEDDIDPSTIDRLIELSSKLHLPADDVIDIINDVEKKKKAVPEPSKKSKALAPTPWDKPRKTPAPYRPPDPRPGQKQRRPPAHKPLPKEDESAWNEVLRGDEYPAPKWHPVKPSHKVSNYISPRTFQPLAYHRYQHLPGPPVAPRGEYYDDSRAHDEELENYLERVLMEHPKAFQ
ncbi:hypothetical protein lerEdw1_006410 [Lerista edwardsae]|nr:hypothetical protein lerEdw1_006410 [Lerista edwardsae]